MIPAQNMALGVPAISLNGSTPRCEHLDGLQPVTPLSYDCRDCRDRRDRRASLAVCLTCGWVACSDDSPSQHARRTTRKPTIRWPPTERDRGGDGATSTSVSSDMASPATQRYSSPHLQARIIMVFQAAAIYSMSARHHSGCGPSKLARHSSYRSRKSGYLKVTCLAAVFCMIFRIHASVVERACKNSHDDRARSGAVRVRTAVVVALASGDGADDQPDDDYDRSDTHDCLRRHVRWGSTLRAAGIATIPRMPAAALDMLADPFSQHIHIPVKAIRGRPDMSNPGKTHHRSRSHRDRRPV